MDLTRHCSDGLTFRCQRISQRDTLSPPELDRLRRYADHFVRLLDYVSDLEERFSNILLDFNLEVSYKIATRVMDEFLQYSNRLYHHTDDIWRDIQTLYETKRDRDVDLWRHILLEDNVVMLDYLKERLSDMMDLVDVYDPLMKVVQSQAMRERTLEHPALPFLLDPSRFMLSRMLLYQLKDNYIHTVDLLRLAVGTIDKVMWTDVMDDMPTDCEGYLATIEREDTILMSVTVWLYRDLSGMRVHVQEHASICANAPYMMEEPTRRERNLSLRLHSYALSLFDSERIVCNPMRSMKIIFHDAARNGLVRIGKHKGERFLCHYYGHSVSIEATDMFRQLWCVVADAPAESVQAFYGMDDFCI